MPGERTILRGGRILRHSRAELVEADLLVEGDRIAAIEPGAASILAVHA